MEDWMSQMIAGFKASHLSSSFEAQLQLYQSKIGRAETELKSMVYYRIRHRHKSLSDAEER